MKKLQLFGLLICMAVALNACLKATVYSNIPELTFTTMELYADSAVLHFDFTDGDGNFGINSDEVEDSNSIFYTCPKSFNLLIEYYEKQNGIWTHIERNPCEGEVGFYYTVPWIKPSGQNQTQKGDIRVAIAPAYYIPSEFDTCRFEVHILDRDFNSSNTVLTTEFLKR